MAKKFEYKVCTREKLDDGTFRGISEKLMELGQEGWEMVGVVKSMSSSSKHDEFFFKREIESQLTHKQERSGYDMSR